MSSLRVRYIQNYRKKTRDRVISGMVYLDMHKPHWRSKVQIDKLNMRYNKHDLLSQIFGGTFTQAMYELDLFLSDAIKYGFHIRGNNDRKWHILTTTWQAVLFTYDMTQEFNMPQIPGEPTKTILEASIEERAELYAE